MTSRATILSFLRQRLAAAKRGKLYNSRSVQMTIENLQMKFDLIRNMPDRRQECEVWKHRATLIQLLPSRDGAQAAQHHRILTLINNCKPQGYEAITTDHRISA
jgi:hypothetical protein